MAIWLLAPAFNEEANIGSFLDAIRKQNWASDLRKLIIVDDGSRDCTVERARERCGEMPVEIIEHGVNQGPGAAFRTGFRAILADATASDIILTMESDSSVDFEVTATMLSEIERGADVCLASCYALGGRIENVPRFRLALSRSANAFARLLLGLGKYRTCSSFYRAYRVSALQDAFAAYGNDLITERGFASMVELLIKLDRLDLRIAEVPCVNDWGDRLGSSSLPVLYTIQRYVAIAARYRRAPRIGIR